MQPSSTVSSSASKVGNLSILLIGSPTSSSDEYQEDSNKEELIESNEISASVSVVDEESVSEELVAVLSDVVLRSLSEEVSKLEQEVSHIMIYKKICRFTVKL